MGATKKGTRKDGKPDKRYKKKNLGGRPLKPIDWKALEQACSIQCTGEECAAFCELDYDTLDRRIRNETEFSGFTDYFKRHSQGGKMSLRRVQFAKALDGNVPMGIWLGKQHLGQLDKPPEPPPANTVQGGVMVVPTMQLPAEWGTAATASQSELKKLARD